MRSELEKKSRRLALILRHAPESAGISLDKNGWANSADIRKVLDVNVEELKEIVETNDKKRFEFTGHGSKIRACQGHSIKVDVELEDVTDAAAAMQLYHGTKRANLGQIMRDGLKKMKRQHVHLTADYGLAVKRAGVDGVVLIVEPAGLKVWKSKNNVYLMDAVPAANIKLM